METAKAMRTRIEERAAADADFRARLLSDPKGAVYEELGVHIPASFAIEVHEESGTSAHLVLPPSSQLTDTDLEMVTGGVARFDW